MDRLVFADQPGGQLVVEVVAGVGGGGWGKARILRFQREEHVKCRR
jgi:hypothetical protein